MLAIADDKSTGTVVIRDERDDGAFVLLLCQEFFPGGGSGIISHPDAPETFPTGFIAESTRTDAEGTEKRKFSLEVDISGMRRGELRFRQQAFVAKALQESLVAEHTAITVETAEEWGFVPPREMHFGGPFGGGNLPLGGDAPDIAPGHDA